MWVVVICGSWKFLAVKPNMPISELGAFVMRMEYLIMQQKTSDLLKEADQRRLAREAQANEDSFGALATNLEKIRQQLIERYTRKPQIPIVPVCTETCCTTA
jgi:hypothetical protein